MWDNGRPQPSRLWAPAARFAAGRLDEDPDAAVLIHCQQGRRRSAMVAYAVLRLRGHDPDGGRATRAGEPRAGLARARLPRERRGVARRTSTTP